MVLITAIKLTLRQVLSLKREAGGHEEIFFLYIILIFLHSSNVFG